MEPSEISIKIRENRKKTGLSQEQLAIDTGLNLRTIQRVESGETVPRGDTLRRLALALNTSPNQLLNWESKEDKNVLSILILSQLSFLVFPILGVIIPLVIWILQKDKIKSVDHIGKSILNFQISWALVFFSFTSFLMVSGILHLDLGIKFNFVLPSVAIMYGYNVLIVVANAIFNWTNRSSFFKPAIKFLS